MQFTRSKVIPTRAGPILPFAAVERRQDAAPACRRIDLDSVPLRPRSRPANDPSFRSGSPTQTEAPDRIRYAVELAGAGIMMAGFLALAILG